MRRLDFLLVLSMLAASSGCSCGDFASGRPAVAVETSPLRLDLGGSWVGEAASGEVRVRNGGHRTAQLVVGELPEGLVVEPVEFSVPAGGEAAVVVSYRPAAAGPYAFEVALGGSGGHVEAVLPVAGEGVDPALELPASLHLGEADVGGRAALQLFVKNLAPLAVRSPVIRFEGPDAAAFAAMFPVGEIPAAGQALLDVSFAPDRRGPAEATMSIAACERCAPATVAVTGTGLGARVDPTPARLDFGVISPGGRRTLELVLRNNGERNARIVSAAVGDPAFRVEAATWPIDLAPGEERQAWVTFEPTAIGDVAATASFLGAHGPYAAVALTGHGGGAVLEVDGAVDLGRVPLGWAGFWTTVVRNVGEAMATEIEEAHVEGSAAWTLPEPVAGLEVGLFPGTIRLALSAAALGRADGELVITTSDLEQRVLRIPLRAEVYSQADCVVRGSPDPLRFGLVRRGGRHVRELSLENAGAGPCLVWGLGLAPGSDPDFSLGTGEGSFLELPPGQRVRVPVTFAPDTLPGTVQRGVATWRTSNAGAPPGNVELTGFAADVDLVAEPNPLDFRRVPLDRVPHEPIAVRNRGGIAATLTGHGWAPGSSPRFTVPVAPAYPAALAPGALVAYEAYYDPDRIGRDRAELEVRVSGYAEPLIVAIEGEGHDGPCGDYCEPPVPVCPGPLAVIVNQPAAIAGSASDPNGDSFTCAWEVIDAPEGSTELPHPPDTCATSFLPDAVGDYRLELTATDDLGNAASCVTVLQVRPPGGGLWVEMYWETYSNDIDLHLLHGGGGEPQLRSSWNRGPWDCYYNNEQAPWDAAGTADDGSLDRDVTTGAGVENIRVDRPTTAQPYHVGLVWYSRHAGSPGTLPVVTNVYCYGVPVANVITTLVKQGTGYNDAPLFVGSVRFAGDGSCTWTPDGSVTF